MDQQHYLSKLLGFTYDTVYKPGPANRVAHVLSQMPDNPFHMMGLSIPHFDFTSKLKKVYQSDSKLSKLHNDVAADPLLHPSFQLVNGLLLCHGKI